LDGSWMYGAALNYYGWWFRLILNFQIL
jgi:hypothetical protein